MTITPVEFLRLLFGDAPPAYISLWNGRTRLSHHTRDPEAAGATAVRWSASGQDAYFGVGLRREDLGASKRGKRSHVSHVPGLFADVDLAGEGHAAGNLPPTVDDALPLVAAAGFEPTVIIHSGRGLHIYWLFTELLELPTYAAVRIYEAALVELQGRIQAAARARGWLVDNTAEAARVLRLPGTGNFKVPTAPVPVVLLDASGPRHTAASLMALAPADAPITAPLSAVQVMATPDPNTPAPAIARPGSLPTRAAVEHRLRNLTNPHHAALAANLLAGRSLADTERDRALQSLCSVVAWIAPHNDPATLADLFDASLAVWAAEPAARLTAAEERAKVLDKITRAQEDARAELARVAAEDAAITALLQAAPTGAIPGETPPPLAPAVAATFESVARCKPEELARRWVIQCGKSYYLLTDAGDAGIRYAGPFQREALRTAMPQYLKSAPIQWITFVNGKPKQLTVDEILDAHSTVAERVAASLRLQRSYYDSAECTFHEAVCPERTITPAYHPDIDAWLRALGGTEADKLLDWVATYTDLTQPTCALYLSGDKESGKTLLAHGLARLWTTGNPTELGRILENFNEDLVRCPLIFADEALPADARGRQTSARLRELITSPTRTLARKYVSNTDLRGYVRLILAANNDRLLAFSEDFDPRDIQAIAERFLHIDTSAAADYLVAHGGPAHVRGWVEDDLIAAHALWLRENRQVVRAGRFLVKGHTSRAHQTIATRGALQGLVVEWLAKHLSAPSASIPRGAAVRVGGGRYLVNTQVVTDFWEQYVRSDRTPDLARVGRVLRGVSLREVRLNGVRCHEIDAEVVVRWAEDHQVGQVDTMRTRLDGPIDTDDVVAPATVQPDAAIGAVMTAAAENKNRS